MSNSLSGFMAITPDKAFHPEEAIDIAKKIGDVYVDMEGTACKVPSAVDYIKKMEAKGYIGKKKKTVKC